MFFLLHKIVCYPWLNNCAPFSVKNIQNEDLPSMCACGGWSASTVRWLSIDTRTGFIREGEPPISAAIVWLVTELTVGAVTETSHAKLQMALMARYCRSQLIDGKIFVCGPATCLRGWLENGTPIDCCNPRLCAMIWLKFIIPCGISRMMSWIMLSFWGGKFGRLKNRTTLKLPTHACRI